MNHSLHTRCTTALSLLGLLAALNTGCDKKNDSCCQPAGKTASASKTSFGEVTAQLDSGGILYGYLGTAQWLDGLSGTIEGWRSKITSIPGVSDSDRTDINKAFDIVTRIVKDSGLEDVSGMGMSSIEVEPGLYRNKMFLHHSEGKGTGFLWKLGGKEAHPLASQDMLPASTALAIFTDMDVPLLWTVIQDQVNKANIPEAKRALAMLPKEFENATQIPWTKFLGSLGGEFGLALTLNESNNIPLPLPGNQLEIPEPGLMLFIRVNDETLFNRMNQQLQTMEMGTLKETPGLKMRVVEVPLPLPIALKPSVASTGNGGYLIIASSDTLIDEALAVKAGKKPGLKSTAEFKRLAKNIPVKGNGYSYVSARFAKTLTDVQNQFLDMSSKMGGQDMAWLKTLFQTKAACDYTVSVNVPNGIFSAGNGTSSYAEIALLPVVIVPAMLAGVAVPNFVKAKATSQQNACINNQRILDGAKQQWGLENQKSNSAVPTMNDLKPYCSRGGDTVPTCPQGGTYKIGALSESPTCSVHGNLLN